MFPIKDDVPGRYPPLATWALIAINIGVFAVELALPERMLEYVFYRFGVVPARFTNAAWAMEVGFPMDGMVPFVTSQFLHADWLHLVFNLWTLWIFGDNVEDRLGPARYLVLYLVGGVAASAIHIAADPISVVPAIGASGAISAVLGAYLLLFPMARVLILVPVLFIPFFFEVPAFFYLMLWFGIQLSSGAAALLEPAQGGGVAWWAHVGGFVAGAVLLLGLLPRRGRPLYGDEYGTAGAWRPRPAGTGGWARGRRWN